MNLRRLAAVLALSAWLAGCHDEEYVTVVETPPTGFSAPSSATGLTGFDETLGSSDVGSDGLPRLAFLRTFSTTSQVMFTCLTSAGTWTTPLGLSEDDADAKSSILALVTSNNNYTHVFWLENNAVHYTRVTNADPPAKDATADNLQISILPPANVTLTATMGNVSTLAGTVDRSSNNVYVAWTQSIDDDAGGGGAADVVPVGGTVVAGAGLFQEMFALVDPNTDGNPAIVTGGVTLRVSAQGILHAAWVGTDAAAATDAVRHSARTAASTWSGGAAGDVVSDGGTATYIFGDLLLAASGDAYAVWLQGGADIRAAYRAVGDANTFGAPVDVVTGLASVMDVQAALEPGTEFLHAFWQVDDGDVSFYARNYPAADLTGSTWSATDILLDPVTAYGGEGMAAWADSANRVVFVFQAPPVSGEVPRTQIRTRPTGAASVFESAVDLTANFALPCSGLAVARNGSGSAIIVWEQGEGNSIPLSDIFGMVYTTGGNIGGTANISQTAATGSLAPFFVQMTDSSVGHLFWHEETLSGIYDLHYARTE